MPDLAAPGPPSRPNADFVLGNVRLPGGDDRWSIRVRRGLIEAIERGIDAEGIDGEGLLALAGFVDTHVHLDKALILDRCPVCEGSLAEAVRLTAAAKAAFTEDDVYVRARTVLERAILKGTLAMRSFVEVDPRVGLRSFHALHRLKRDFADSIDLQLCAFAQEGTSDEPATLALIEQALEQGADLVGGCPYTDRDPAAHVAALFDVAERHGVDIDFHVDFDLDPDGSILPEIVRQTNARGYGGRVSVGHATKLSAIAPERAAAIGRELAAAGIALSVLPATDLFLNGQGADRLRPRGVAPAALLDRCGATVSLATNNVMNPFTPFGDASLLRIANLYANVDQLASDGAMERVLAMITDGAARQIGIGYGLAVGRPADIVLVNAGSTAEAVRAVPDVVAAWKRGRRLFRRPLARLDAAPSPNPREKP